MFETKPKGQNPPVWSWSRIKHNYYLLPQVGHFREWISKPDHSTLAQVVWKLICGCVKLGYFDIEPLNNLEVVVLKTLVFFFLKANLCFWRITGRERCTKVGRRNCLRTAEKPFRLPIQSFPFNGKIREFRGFIITHFILASTHSKACSILCLIQRDDNWSGHHSTCSIFDHSRQRIVYNFFGDF